MTKTRGKIDAALKAKIALEVLREQATVTDLAQRRQVYCNDGGREASRQDWPADDRERSPIRSRTSFFVRRFGK
jgi:hypothetical protein